MLNAIVERLQPFIESEGKSYSFDPEVIVAHGSWRVIYGSRIGHTGSAETQLQLN